MVAILSNLKWIILVLIILALFTSFFVTDYIRAKNNEKPIFAINTRTYSDGGTKEYLGFGYKVITYVVIDQGITDDVICKIGTWFLKYDTNYPRYK